MTTTIVFAAAGDGFLQSSSTSYASARAGSSVGVPPAGDIGAFGQNVSGGTYAAFQTFISFAWSAIPATEVVTSAAIQVRIAAMLSPGVARDLEVRGNPWLSGGLTASDWIPGANLPSYDMYALFSGINTAPTGSRTRAGSETLRAYLASGATSGGFTLVSSRLTAGAVPTGDEGGAIYISSAAGTVDDPALIFTSVSRSRLLGVLGAQAPFAGESSWAVLENTGSAIELRQVATNGSTGLIGTVPIGTTAGTFAAPTSAQSLALVVDPSNGVYVIGRSGAGAGSIAVLPYTFTTSWVAGTMRTAALPAHPAPISQVSATYLATSPDSIMVIAARGTGPATPSGSTDTAWVTFSISSLLTGSGAIPLGVGDASGIAPAVAPAGDFGGQRNEVGAGLDLSASVDNPGWLYAGTLHRGQAPGDNAPISFGRLTTTTDGASVTYQAAADSDAYGTKDATSKIRTVDATGGVAALVTADRDAGYGLSVAIAQHFAPPTAPVTLGTIRMASESITGMPDGPAVGTSLAWDVIYSSVEHRLWVYYVDAANPRVIKRTPIGLDSYTATRAEVTVYTAPVGATIQAIRTVRGSRVQNRSLLSVAYLLSGTQTMAYAVDPLNQPPTAPVQTPRAGLDATQAAALAWTFTDPNPGDTQSAYQLQIEDAAAPGVAVVDTGKVASTAGTRTIAGGTLANAKTYQWRVRTWDALDTIGPYSGWSSFPTAAGGTVTITFPASDNPAGWISADIQITWSVLGSVQTGYRVWLYRGGVPVSDSGWITSTAATHLVTGMTSGVQHEIRVQVRNAALTTSNIASRLITPDYSTPEPPIVTVTPLGEQGHTEIKVLNPAGVGSRPEVYTNEIYRRTLGGAWALLGAVPPNGTYRDYGASSGVTYEYRVRGIA